MFAIALFIIFSLSALFFSSQGLFQNLQALNQDNNILNITSQALESLNTTELRLPEVISRTNISELHYRFNENLKVTEQLIAAGINRTIEGDIHNNFVKVSEALKHVRANTDQTINRLFAMKDVNNKKEISEISADVLASKQYLLDAKELLIKIQITTKDRNDAVFNNIYKNRYRPILVTVLLSTLFFTFVITFGLSISRKIGRSISNLLQATDKVAGGSLNYQARIMYHDEIGRLTDAFNKMIIKLKTGQDELGQAVGRTNDLQSITAAFSEALTPEQVFNVVFEKAFKSLNAVYGTVIMISEDGNNLEMKRTIGLPDDLVAKWKSFPISTELPVTECIRHGKPIFVISKEMHSEKYAATEINHLKGKDLLNTYLPLIIGSEVLGALTLAFKRTHDFDEAEKEFMIALARQCAQAIHRSQLYDDARKAIEARDEFLSIASHELRTPLTPLKLQLQGLERHIVKGTINELPIEKIIKIIQSSDRQINRLSTLIDDLLDVSRITTGRLSLNREKFSIQEMINEVVAQYSQQLKTSQSN